MSGTKTVITTFKNEAPYILEWVAHYRTLGFDNIIVYTNDCSDGTNRILRRLEELGEVTFRINHVGAAGIHRSALRQARRLDAVKASDWLFVCDIDEFLNIHVGNHRIDDLIAASDPGVDAIAIPWKIFSNNGRSVLRNQLVTEQFTDAELPPVEGGATRRFVKTLFRPSDKINRIGLHGPVLKEEHAGDYLWATPGDTRLSRQSLGGHVPPPFGIETAQLNHYAVRSVESYLLKKHRGRANHMSESLSTEYWDRWNRGGAEDRSIQRYLPAIQERMEVYLADDTLNRLHRRGFRWHKDLLANAAGGPGIPGAAHRLRGPADDPPGGPGTARSAAARGHAAARSAGPGRGSRGTHRHALDRQPAQLCRTDEPFVLCAPGPSRDALYLRAGRECAD